ncbi:MAG TPA: hypothetical protein VMU39_31120 [Solirubrobacteraceae bacterium]|nr:hypothetical protein [Solirubrobacteraceae bacterium]
MATAARTSASVGAPFAGAALTLAGWLGEGACEASTGGDAGSDGALVDRFGLPTPAVGSITCGCARAVVCAGAAVLVLGAGVVP